MKNVPKSNQKVTTKIDKRRKTTPRTIRYIYALHDDGYSLRKIGAEIGLSAEGVRYILKRRHVMKKRKNAKKNLNIHEMAKLIGISDGHFWSLRKRGIFPQPIRADGQLYYDAKLIACCRSVDYVKSKHKQAVKRPESEKIL